MILSISLVACSKEEVTLPSSGQFEGGTWYADCFSKDGAYQKRTAKFDGGSYSHSMTIYSDPSCSVQQIETGETGIYVIGGPISEGSHSMKLDLTIGALTVKPLNPTVANQYNSSSLCGITTWTAGVAQNVTGLNCGGGNLPAVGTTYYDIYMIYPFTLPDVPGYPGSGSKEGEMSFGYNDATYDGSTPDRRPTAVTSPNYHR